MSYECNTKTKIPSFYRSRCWGPDWVSCPGPHCHGKQPESEPLSSDSKICGMFHVPMTVEALPPLHPHPLLTARLQPPLDVLPGALIFSHRLPLGLISSGLRACRTRMMAQSSMYLLTCLTYAWRVSAPHPLAELPANIPTVSNHQCLVMKCSIGWNCKEWIVQPQSNLSAALQFISKP